MSKKNQLTPLGAKQSKLPFVLSFLIPFVVMLAICIGKGVYPFGDMTFLRTDLYHQYCPFYTDFANRLKNFQSLTYAWDIGLGSNYSALFAYYLCCPTGIFLYLIPESLIIEFMTLMIIVKIGLAGYAMSKFLAYRGKGSDLSIVIFSICYALCGYLAAYSWNIMWLDVIFLAPLVIMGLEKLVREDKPIFYCITLAIAILTNYYISIMLCIFLVIYFFGLLIMIPKKSFGQYVKKTARFVLYSALAGGIAAVVFLPALFALGGTASAYSTFPTTVKTYFAVITMFSKHFAFLECETGLDYWPNIYCSIGALLFLPMYYMNKKVNFKEKIVKTVIIFIFLFSFSVNIPSFIWHGFHYPNSLPARQSYLYIILLLSMGYEGFMGVKDLSKGKIIGSFVGVAGYILLCQRIVPSAEITLGAVLGSLAFVAAYALFTFLYNTVKMKKVTAVVTIICILVVELGVNMAYTSVKITSRSTYVGDRAPYQTLLSNLNDDSFYRVEKVNHRTKNDGAFVGYNSACIFSSTTNAAVSDTYKKFGEEGNVNAYSFNGATPFIASILGVKYLLADSTLPASSLYSLKASEGNYSLYENTYTLPLGFMVPTDIQAQWMAASINPTASQNTLAKILGSSSDLLTAIPGNTNASNFSTSVNEKEHVYVFVENSSVKNVTAQIGGTTKTFSDVNRRFLLDLGIVEPGVAVSLSTSDEGETLTATAYTFNETEFVNLYQKLNKQVLENITITDTLTTSSVSGTVEALRDGNLFMSVPYDEGWTVMVDGQEITPDSLDKAFFLIPLKTGTHNIEMFYNAPGLKLGAIISGASLLVLIACIIILRIVNKDRERYASNEITDMDELTVDAVMKKAGKDELLHLDDNLDDDDEDLPEKVLQVNPQISASSSRKQSVEKTKKEMKDRK